MKANGLRLRFNPVNLVLTACSNLYGDLLTNVAIDLIDSPLRGKNKVAGFTQFPAIPGQPIIVAINCKLPFMSVPEIIAHEIAHVILGAEENHGKVWELVFNDITAEYNRLAEEELQKM